MPPISNSTFKFRTLTPNPHTVLQSVEKTIQELCVGLSFTQLFNILANVILFFFVVWPHFQTLEPLRVLCISEREKSYLLVFAAYTELKNAKMVQFGEVVLISEGLGTRKPGFGFWKCQEEIGVRQVEQGFSSIFSII